MPGDPELVDDKNAHRPAQFQYFEQAQHQPRTDRFFYRDLSDAETSTLLQFMQAHPLESLVTPMPDAVVWVPTRSAGSEIHRTLGVGAGGVVQLAAGANPAGAK